MANTRRGKGAPGGLDAPNGTIYTDTNTGISYIQNDAPTGDNWTKLDTTTSNDVQFYSETITTLNAMSINAMPPRLMDTEAMFSYLNFGYIAPNPVPSPLTEMQSITTVPSDRYMRIPPTFIARFVRNTRISISAVTGINP